MKDLVSYIKENQNSSIADYVDERMIDEGLMTWLKRIIMRWLNTTEKNVNNNGGEYKLSISIDNATKKDKDKEDTNKKKKEAPEKKDDKEKKETKPEEVKPEEKTNKEETKPEETKPNQKPEEVKPEEKTNKEETKPEEETPKTEPEAKTEPEKEKIPKITCVPLDEDSFLKLMKSTNSNKKDDAAFRNSYLFEKELNNKKLEYKIIQIVAKIDKDSSIIGYCFSYTEGDKKEQKLLYHKDIEERIKNNNFNPKVKEAVDKAIAKYNSKENEKS